MQNTSAALGSTDDSGHAVSWAAIFAGTFATIALTLILVGLGTGMGLAASPWSHDNMSAAHFSYIAATWLIIVQWVSAGLGGYLTGRLRTKWAGVHTHEVFFRDTAHGFLTWCVATVFGAGILLAAASAGGHHGMMGKHEDGPAPYYIDSLFRGDHPGTLIDKETKEETVTILMKGVRDGGLSDEDRLYLGELISSHGGVAQADAERKANDMVEQLRGQAQDAAKIAATVSIFTFVSMLIGAFIASVAAALGGQERDEPRYPAV